MKILVNTDTFEPLGGVERSTLQVSGELVARGHDCRLLHAAQLDPNVDPNDDPSDDPNNDPNDDQAAGGELRAAWTRTATSMERVPGFTVAARRPWRTAHQLPAAIRAAARISPDVIYLNRSEQLPWALAARRAAHAGLVVHLRHHPFPQPLVRLFCSRPAGAPRVRFVAVSDFLRDEWVGAGLNPDVVRVVPNGIDPLVYRAPSALERQEARAELGILDGRRIVLCYGRLSPEKGIDTLLDAWPRVSAQNASATLVLVGDTTPAIAARIASASGVRHLPRRTDVLALLHAADLVVLPAHWDEPFGRVVIEAMAAGVPVIASRVGGIPEILTGRFADQLVPPADVEALARHLIDHLDWRDRTPGLGAAGRDEVERSFTLSRTVDVVESLLLEVATAHPKTTEPSPAPQRVAA